MPAQRHVYTSESVTEGHPDKIADQIRSEEHTSELQSRSDLVCRLLLEKKKKNSHTLIELDAPDVLHNDVSTGVAHLIERGAEMTPAHIQYEVMGSHRADGNDGYKIRHS